jgi:hypothetical protein
MHDSAYDTFIVGNLNPIERLIIFQTLNNYYISKII